MNPTTETTSLTQDQLQEIINNRPDYLPETVEAAISELENRGHVFAEDDLKVIHEDIQAQRNNALVSGVNSGWFNNNYKNVFVKDPAAPLMFSRRAIYVFTFLMGALFGSVMLAVNIYQTPKRINAIWALLFGIGFTALQVFAIGSMNNPSPSVNYLFGIAAALCIDYVWWGKTIGNSTFYRVRAIWIPLAIALLLVAFISLSALSGRE